MASELWLRGRKRLGLIRELKGREARVAACMSWKAHVPGVLDQNLPVQRMAKEVFAAGIDPEKRSVRQLMRVIADVRAHVDKNPSENSSLTSDTLPPGVLPWDDFKQIVAENVENYRQAVAQLSQLDPEQIPADTLIKMVDRLERALLEHGKKRRPSLAKQLFGDEEY